MTTDLTRTWMDDLDQLPEEIPGAANLEPGRLAWLHGTSAGNIKTPGVFYGRDTAFGDMPPEPWAVDTRYEEQGETGYSTPTLRLALIGWRDQWFMPGAERGDLPEWLTAYQDGAKKLVEYLLLIDGLLDPVVLSVSGKYKAGPFNQIFSNYRRGALAQAMRKVKRTLPPWAHWLTVAGRRDSNSRPVYEKAEDSSGKEYGSVVTVPVIIAPPIAVSLETMRFGIETYEVYKASGWFDYKRLPRGTTEASYAVEERPALPEPKNKPELIDPDNEPF
jgi:hypothetical protein